MELNCNAGLLFMDADAQNTRLLCVKTIKKVASPMRGSHVGAFSSKAKLPAAA